MPGGTPLSGTKVPSSSTHSSQKQTGQFVVHAKHLLHLRNWYSQNLNRSSLDIAMSFSERASVSRPPCGSPMSTTLGTGSLHLHCLICSRLHASPIWITRSRAKYPRLKNSASAFSSHFLVTTAIFFPSVIQGKRLLRIVIN